MTRKIISIFLILTLCLPFAACSVDNAYSLRSGTDSDTQTQTTGSSVAENLPLTTDNVLTEDRTPTIPHTEVKPPQQSIDVPIVEVPGEDPELDEFWIMQDGVGFLGTFHDPKRDTTDYIVEITDITINSVTFRVGYFGVNGSPYYETNLITAKVNLLEDPGYAGITDSFTWEDSWGNQGIGTLQLGGLNYIEGTHILLTMTVTKEAEFNRATLATNGPLHLEQ